MRENQKKWLRWCFWLFVGNVIFFWLIGLNYLPTIPWMHSAHLTVKWAYELYFFVVISFLGQLALLAAFPGLLSIVCLWSRRCRFIFPLLLFTVVATLLVADTIIYHLYRFHLNGVVFHLIAQAFNKKFFDLSSKEYVLIITIPIAIACLESFYGWVLWRYVMVKNRLLGMGKWIVIVLGLCLYLSYSMIIFSSGEIFHRILVESTRFLPGYAEIMERIFLGNHVMARTGEHYFEHGDRNNTTLNYPTQPLQFKAPHEKFNLVIILVDAWRFDMLDKNVTPSLYALAKQSWYFSQHHSGGNATGPGVFSLFYGIPPTYWSAMETQQHGPVLVDALLKQHYKAGIFLGGAIRLPAFNKTVFSAIKGFPEDPEGSPYERDKILTHRFIAFLDEAQQSKQPFFAYIHFVSAHGYCAFQNNFSRFYPTVNQCNREELGNQSNPLPYLNRYKNALYSVDQQVQAVLNALKERHLDKHTVIVVTGDHGEEFNDNHQGYWSHASNYTTYQTRTPLIVHWPGEKSKVFFHPTNHYDIAPTLMSRLLGCKSPFSVYSVGVDLLDSKTRLPYLLVGGYIDLGILEKDRITRVFSTGEFQVEGVNSEPKPSEAPHLRVIQEAFLDMRRFYK